MLDQVMMAAAKVFGTTLWFQNEARLLALSNGFKTRQGFWLFQTVSKLGQALGSVKRNGIYNYPRKYKLPIPGIIVPSRFTVNSTHHRN
eukprot:g57697.t1